MASSLTQVLAETTGQYTTTYLYGLGLVGEMKTSVGMAEYHLTDPGSSVLLSQTFDPYSNRYEQSLVSFPRSAWNAPWMLRVQSKATPCYTKGGP